MDWRSIQFDWNRARAFLVTAEEGSFSAASNALGVAQPTLGRQVSALEEELGVALFERVGRGMQLTQTGYALVEHVRAMGIAANQLSITASGHTTSLTGTVCISVTETMAYFFLCPILKKLRIKYPGITVEVVVSNATSDLRRREADIAIRHVTPSHGELVAKKLPDMKANLYASDTYLKSFGQKVNLESLATAEFIGFPANQELIDALKATGLHLSKENFSIITDNHLVHWALVKQGVGICIMPELIGDQEPGISRVLRTLESLPFETWLVTHRELRTSLKIRSVFDFLENELQQLV